ncbi:hypothetical protein HNQ91_004916 [Filimonas zeae]|nr:hypothetical protein [Filimonas zeae]MDR6341839.1 hypothetical protein [Filimonas zeae]
MRVNPGKTNIWATKDVEEKEIPVQGKAAIALACIMLFGFFIKILFI